ncbi:hypothetical protein KI688_003190 [Linnemannia hyalina]|uniref:Acid phosphatase n=1 Tax=Linnemannia hyalina TaxID=64524 RepID=A0A9P8BR64_9FUNG|nr:hypothetical protein KI688_003190 [Linnemannia hyalina]
MLFNKLVSLALLAATGSSCADVPKGAAFDHIFIIFLENTDYDLANSDPNLRSLFSSGVALSNYHGVTHSFQPNYFTAIAGDFFVTGTDSPTTWAPLTRRSSTFWKQGSDLETLPGGHALDLQAGNLPNYSSYTPNVKSDGHDTTVAYASNWSTGFLALLLSNPTFNNDTLVVLTFDEADDYFDSCNHVLGLLLGSAVHNIKNTVDSTFYTQYSLISTVTANWVLTVWVATISTSPSPTSLALS